MEGGGEDLTVGLSVMAQCPDTLHPNFRLVDTKIMLADEVKVDVEGRETDQDPVLFHK